MNYFASIEFLPARFSTNLLKTLRDYAHLLDEHCQLGHGEEIDSSHYVEDTYFAWKYDDYSIKLFWSDEAKTSEWLWITVDSRSDNVMDIVDKIMEGLKPFASDTKIFLRPSN
jgi:hypothetical protein